MVWDLETVPDLQGFAAAHGHDGKTDDEIREALGEKFPKNKVSASGLVARLYFHRYAEGAVDLCDVLASFTLGEKRRCTNCVE